MKLFWLVTLLLVELSAFDTVTASKIFEKIFTGMFMQRSITVYSSNKEYREVIVLAPSLKLVDRYQKADIVLANAWSELPLKYKGVVFTTNTSIFQKNNHAVGAFYWEHGRPKIYFLEQRLKAKNIRLSKPMQRYIVRELP